MLSTDGRGLVTWEGGARCQGYGDSENHPDSGDLLESSCCKTLVVKVFRDPLLSSEIPWRVPHPHPLCTGASSFPGLLTKSLLAGTRIHGALEAACLSRMGGPSDISVSLYLLSCLRITQMAAPPGNPGPCPCLNINITSTIPRNKNG